MKPRTLIKFLAGCVALAAMADSCSPVITVTNNTTFEVVATINNGGKRQVVSPSPGNSSSAEAEQGVYTVTIIPSQEWRDHAQATRDFLNDQLAHPENLTGEQLKEVIRRLKDIAAKIKAFEDSYKALSGQSCTGAIGDNGGGAVTVSAAADGALSVTCSGPSGP
jgi:hypothetical protein